MHAEFVNLDSKLYMVGQNVLYEIPCRSGGQEGLNLNTLNEMFDQAAASATEEKYPEDCQPDTYRCS